MSQMYDSGVQQQGIGARQQGVDTMGIQSTKVLVLERVL